MSYELGDQLPAAPTAEGASKPLKAFYQLKTLDKGTVIEGIHQGRFESKKTPGYFFHVFKQMDDEGYAYGACAALDERINEVIAKQDELGQKIYAKIVYNGRIPSKKNPKMTYYSFSAPVMFPVVGSVHVAAAPAATHTSSDVPF